MRHPDGSEEEARSAFDLIEGPGQLSVGGPPGLQLLGAIFELALEFHHPLFEGGDRWRWSMSVGAPRPESRQACLPRCWESRFSSCRTRAVSRTLRSRAFARTQPPLGPLQSG